MKVFIRADASLEIGSGHVMRCLALAGALRDRGAEVGFICRALAGNMCARIAAAGFALLELPSVVAPAPATALPPHARWLGTDWASDARQSARALGDLPPADWLVVDHYALDARWESAMRHAAARIMVLDDLADRAHDCDLLLDQNFYRDERRYAALIPSHCRQTLGPAYALLRPEFAAARRQIRERTGRVARILVFFGASDLGDATLKAMRGLALLARQEIRVDVVVGVNHPNRAALRNFSAAKPQFFCHDYVSDMAALMAAADLYVGAAGTTTWERCCLGLPSLVIPVAANQDVAIRDLAQAGAIRVLRASGELSAANIGSAIQDMLDSPTELAALGRISMALVDGLGTQRIVDTMCEEHGKTP